MIVLVLSLGSSSWASGPQEVSFSLTVSCFAFVARTSGGKASSHSRKASPVGVLLGHPANLSKALVSVKPWLLPDFQQTQTGDGPSVRVWYSMKTEPGL